MTPGPLDNSREFARIWAVVLLSLGAGFAGLGSLVFGIFTAIGGGVWDEWALDQRGATTQATVLEAIPTGVSAGRRKHWHDLSIRFVDGQGATREATLERPGRVEPGAVLTIDYDPQAPDLVRLHGKRATFFGYLPLVPAGLALLGVPLLLAGVWFWRRQRALSG